MGQASSQSRKAAGKIVAAAVSAAKTVAPDAGKVVRKDDVLLRNLAELDMTVKPPPDVPTAIPGIKSVSVRRGTITPARAREVAGLFSQNELREFFANNQRPKDMNETMAAELKELYAACAIFESRGQLYGVWPDDTKKQTAA